MSARPGRARRVAIVGGGLCGAAVAYRLAAVEGVEVTVVEPRETLGAGLAYSTTEPAHRINVPASRMTLVAEAPDDFAAWLARPDGPTLAPGAGTLQGEFFPQRRVFADYVAARLRPALAAGRVRHLRDVVADVRPAGRGFALDLASGGVLSADAVVFAATHRPPATPAPFDRLGGHGALVADPYAPGALDALDPRADVLVLGTGLTSADVIATLDARGHRGQIVALSRGGWRARGHGPIQRASDADFATRPARGARRLLRDVRAAVRADAAAGLTWHATLDAVRAQGPAIWAALDETERRRLLRHLRPIWDVHRFRMAPQVEEALARRARAGRLAQVAGRVQHAVPTPDGRLAVTWRPRGAAAVESGVFGAVVACTGPVPADLAGGEDVYARAARRGLIRPDPLGLGVLTDADGRAIGPEGAASDRLLVAGPLARWAVGELMGVPEVVAQAERVAAVLAGAAASRAAA